MSNPNNPIKVKMIFEILCSNKLDEIIQFGAFLLQFQTISNLCIFRMILPPLSAVYSSNKVII